MPRLAVAEKVAGPALVETARADGEAAPSRSSVSKARGGAPSAAPAVRLFREEVGGGPTATAPDPSAQPVELHHAEAIGPPHGDGVGVGDVEAGFDDVGRAAVPGTLALGGNGSENAMTIGCRSTTAMLRWLRTSPYIALTAGPRANAARPITHWGWHGATDRPRRPASVKGQS